MDEDQPFYHHLGIAPRRFLGCSRNHLLDMAKTEPGRVSRGFAQLGCARFVLLARASRLQTSDISRISDEAERREPVLEPSEAD